uniref:Transcriptional regulator n=1 Tax=Steinernema glaseri TaxID=37863 RepID=A0A1I8AMK0_9BILA
MHARARADIHHVVGHADGVLVVLHHDHRVADVAQVVEGAQQAIVVALVQADGWLVENVHHPHQAGADLAGQADTLGLAARQGIGAAIQRQVVQAHVHQKLQAFADFLEDLVGDLATAPGQLE